MFKHKSNTMCNNILFNAFTIWPMHPSMAMLYEAARASKQLGIPSDVARAMNASPQTIKNWEYRGISKEGALLAQELFGCDANVLRAQPHGVNHKDTSVKNTHQVSEESPQPSLWPFRNVSVRQYALLDEHQRMQVEDYILLQIRGRDSPEKQPTPANYSSQTKAA